MRGPVRAYVRACARSCRFARSCGRSTPSRCPSSWCAPPPADSDRRLGLPTRIADSDCRLGSRVPAWRRHSRQKRKAPPSLRSLSQRSRRVLQQYQPGCVCVWCLFVCSFVCVCPSAVCVWQVSANTDEENILRGFRAGSNDYVRKPFSRAEVLARCATLLSLYFMIIIGTATPSRSPSTGQPGHAHQQAVP